MKMRQLEEETGVSRESIRFYIKEGVVQQPLRPKRNVAIYSDEHVARIKAVRQLQQKRFLPLAVIREVLDSNDASDLLGSTGMSGAERLLPELLRGTTPTGDRALLDVASTTQFEIEEIRALDRIGVISISDNDTLDFRDVALVEQWAEFRKLGYLPAEGFDAEFLAPYLALTQELAKFEIGRFVSAYNNHLNPEQAAERAADGLAVVNQILGLLHNKSVVEELGRVLAEQPAIAAENVNIEPVVPLREESAN